MFHTALSYMSLSNFLRKNIANNTINLVLGIALLFVLTFNLNAAQLVRVQSQNVKSVKSSDSNSTNSGFFADLHYNPAFTFSTHEGGFAVIYPGTNLNLLATSTHSPKFKFGWVGGGLGVGYKFAGGFSAALDFGYMNLASDWEEKNKRYGLPPSAPIKPMRPSAPIALESANQPPYTEGTGIWSDTKTIGTNEQVPQYPFPPGILSNAPSFAGNKVGYIQYEYVDPAGEGDLIGAVNRTTEVAVATGFYDYKGFHLVSGLIKVGYDYDFMNSFGIYGDLGLGASYLITKGSLRRKIPFSSLPSSLYLAGSAGIGASYAFSKEVKLKLGYQLFWTPTTNFTFDHFTLDTQEPTYHPPRVNFMVTSRKIAGEVGAIKGFADTEPINYPTQRYEVVFGHLLNHSVNLSVNLTF